MRPLDLPPYIEIGLTVHAAMEGKQYETTAAVERHVRSLHAFWKDKGYKLAGTKKQSIEVVQEVSLGPRLILVRKLDRLAYQDGRGAIVDWKTASSDWEPLALDHRIIPKALGFQRSSYLYPPEDSAPYTRWPDELDYIVSSSTRPNARCYAVYRDREAEKEFVEAAKVVARAKTFPRNMGWQCKWCMYQSACYETQGWQDEYAPIRDARGVPEAFGDDA